MSIMRDTNLGDDWLRDVMTKNPPRERQESVFSGPVRLSFPNLFKPLPETEKIDANKFVATLLFPPGTDMSVFERAWLKVVREKYPKDFDAQGNPQGLESPFRKQDEKAFGDKPRAGYTPGGIFLKASTYYQPPVYDLQKQVVRDEDKIYPGVWVYADLNLYTPKQQQLKKGAWFGLRAVMLLADDKRLGGGGGSPEQSFGHVTITAQSNVASRFDDVPSAQKPAGASIMPAGGHVGRAGTLPTHPVETDQERELREMGLD